jgi:hypothetical protein
MLGESQQAREMLARRFEREARATAALGSIHTVGDTPVATALAHVQDAPVPPGTP